MSDVNGTESTGAELPLERGSRTWLWVLMGVVGVAVIAVVGTVLMSKSVVYYKTASEVVTQKAGTQVRLAGTLVPHSIVAQPNSGETDFKVTDGKTVIEVVYIGSASTALSTASKPGTQIVAEGQLGADHIFRSQQLLAKCPSKYSAKYVAKTSADNN